jgi:hypothetical protein
MKIVRLIHRWTGGLIGLLLALMGLSGALLVHEDAFLRATVPHAADVQRQDAATLGAAATRIFAAKDRPRSIVLATSAWACTSWPTRAGPAAQQGRARGLCRPGRGDRPELDLELGPAGGLAVRLPPSPVQRRRGRDRRRDRRPGGTGLRRHRPVAVVADPADVPCPALAADDEAGGDRPPSPRPGRPGGAAADPVADHRGGDEPEMVLRRDPGAVLLGGRDEGGLGPAEDQGRQAGQGPGLDGGDRPGPGALSRRRGADHRPAGQARRPDLGAPAPAGRMAAQRPHHGLVRPGHGRMVADRDAQACRWARGSPISTTRCTRPRSAACLTGW